MPAVTMLGLPPELRRSLACTNIIENVMGTVRRVSRNAKYWRSPSMALRWAGAGMQEAAKGFRRRKAYKQPPLFLAALAVRKAGANPPPAAKGYFRDDHFSVDGQKHSATNDVRRK
jgi:putative transposase